jgi:bacterioferritin-associated ferredoxin
MFVCHCHVVSDRSVHAAISAGATDVDEVMDHCGLGDACGGCIPAVEDLLAEAALAVREPQRLLQRQRSRRAAWHAPLPQPA